MSQQADSTTRSWKFVNKDSGEHWPLFTGDFQYLNEVLVDKASNSAWLLLQYLNSLLRSYGQVIFANNPVSGALILLGIAIANYQAFFASLFTCTLSFIFALLSRQDSNAILNGGFGCNPVLHGIVSVSVLPNLYPQVNISEPKFWLFLTVTTIISVYITSAFNSLFGHIGKYPIPCFTLPFNVIQFMLIFCLLHNSLPSDIVSQHLLISPQQRLNQSNVIGNTANTGTNISALNITNQDFGEDYNSSEQLHWGDTFAGTVVALSQVYGINNVLCAALMYLALFVFSPLTAGFAYMGSLLGTLLGLIFASNHEEIYDGVWGYNGLLCAGALGGFCFVLNVQSTMIAITSVFFSTALQHFMMPLAEQTGFPILTMPFNLTTILFLFITTEKEHSLPRPRNLTFPEQHRYLYKNFSTGEVQGYLQRSKEEV